MSLIYWPWTFLLNFSLQRMQAKTVATKASFVFMVMKFCWFHKTYYKDWCNSIKWVWAKLSGNMIYVTKLEPHLNLWNVQGSDTAGDRLKNNCRLPRNKILIGFNGQKSSIETYSFNLISTVIHRPNFVIHQLTFALNYSINHLCAINNLLSIYDVICDCIAGTISGLSPANHPCWLVSF